MMQELGDFSKHFLVLISSSVQFGCLFMHSVCMEYICVCSVSVSVSVCLCVCVHASYNEYVIVF